MACFLVPTAEAIVVTAVAAAMKAKANSTPALKAEGEKEHPHTEAEKAPFHAKLMWLAKLLWGGAFLLAFEHLWHGEVVPWFPFLTAAAAPADAAVMLHEMSTVGVTMALLVTAVWAVMLIVSNTLEKRAPMANALSSSPAYKIGIYGASCPVNIAGRRPLTASEEIKQAVALLKQHYAE